MHALRAPVDCENCLHFIIDAIKITADTKRYYCYLLLLLTIINVTFTCFTSRFSCLVKNLDQILLGLVICRLAGLVTSIFRDN